MTDSDFRFLGESPSRWSQEPREALIRVIRINPRNGLPKSENPFNQINLWLKIKKFRSHPLNPLNRSAGTCL
jgi:hypothetical protein